jgi:alkylation response protein AidB-like acyl-CoA dehydrogenase
MPPIFNFGTEGQKQRWLVPGIAGEKIGALGITEPGAGSDVAGISTFAERVDGGYVVNGSKTFITNGVRADFLVCACKTSEEGGHGGISFLVLEREMPGYEVAAKLEKMGWHSSDTGELAFTDVEVPAENLLGEENGGFKLIMANFAWERLLMAIGAVGGMQRLVETTVAYVQEREAFGRPIGKFQAIRHQVAEMALDRMDRDCSVELRAVAGGFARVVADATVDGRERVVVREHPPGLLVLADPGVRQPALDVLARRAGVVARGQQVDIHRTLRPHRARTQPGLPEWGERGEVAL